MVYLVNLLSITLTAWTTLGSASEICTKCHRKESFFHRQYSGEMLCKRCFAESIEGKVRATIFKYKMFNYRDKIAIAVSGGKDSISLLRILAKMEHRYPKASLVAITVDEGIKGYRDEALRITEENCKALGMDSHVVSFTELFGASLDEIVERTRRNSKNELTPCAYCGVLRRRALNIAAREVGANKIATAHTLDDEVQTILMNIFHGDVLRLATEKPVTDNVHPKLIQKVKPLCEIPEKESALYAYVKRIEFQDTPCPYASEALRNDVRVMLNRVEEKHAGTKFTIFQSIERIRPALEESADKGDFKECLECGEPASQDLCKTCQLLKQIR
jgi:uncharacterized protein (TIGR00269 family)